jgi:DNA-binding response OmpR family regulator
VGKDEKHILVSMRMIGHKILLSSGDSLSPVLPITKDAGRYKIQFDSDFQFNPEGLVATIDSVIKKTNIANNYMVEVEKCETGEVIYSYEIGGSAKADIIPCRTRMPAKACYYVAVTILDAAAPDWLSESALGQRLGSTSIIALIIAALILIGLVMYVGAEKVKSQTDPINLNLIPLGEYQFDAKNSELLVEDQRVALSSKESDLLLLLYNAANTTVERKIILKNVWGDEGDYIGRTLDVFISKLRKKLEHDTSLKIVNVRGVGYKLVMNTPGQ